MSSDEDSTYEIVGCTSRVRMRSTRILAEILHNQSIDGEKQTALFLSEICPLQQKPRKLEKPKMRVGRNGKPLAPG